MNAVVPVSAFLLGFAPLAPEHWGLLVFLLIAKGAGVWYFLNQKMKALVQQHADQSAAVEQAHAAALQAQKEAAAKQATEAKAAFQRLEGGHKELLEASKRREHEDAQRIASLTADLAASRETAAQLEPTKMRVSDLDAALASERGRVGALEKAVEVSSKRAGDFETRLEQAHRSLTELREGSGQRESELQAGIAKLEQTVRANESLVSSAESQISQANETLSSYKQQAETRIANLQRQLAAAEAKSALVQKEFMSAVGVLPDKPAASARTTPAASGDGKRITELEAKITQIEADARKKSREDGYKIAELEFRLNEAQEAVEAAKAAQRKAAEVEVVGSPAAAEAPTTQAVVPDPDPAPAQAAAEGA